METSQEQQTLHYSKADKEVPILGRNDRKIQITLSKQI